jgi:chitosanase
MRIVIASVLALTSLAYGCSASTDGSSLNPDDGDSGTTPTNDAGTPPPHADGGVTSDGSTSDASTSDSSAADASSHDSSATDSGPQGAITPLQKHKAEMLTSIWENSTTVLQYPYCQNIRDGRGYTSGRAGFCSGTGDAIQVVQCFDTAFGTGTNNPMAKYMPALTTINNRFNSTGQNQGSTSELDAVGSYCSDWSKTTSDAATSAAFKSCQDQITDLLYYQPGLAQAKKWGLVTALTIAELYDAEINHGDDGVAALIKQANTDTGNAAQHPPSAPLTQAAESTWLHAFLMRRLALLKSDATWAQSEDRVTTYEQLRRDGNFDLGPQIRTNAKAVTMFPGQGYVDSGYPDCIIAPDGAVSGDASCTSPTGQ